MSPRSRSRSAKLNLASSSYASKPNLKANVFPTDPDFTALVQKIEAAIEKGVDPKLITQGSSGSYFVPNEEGEILAIFKPKDEEPFADRNPKWPKWFQRHLSPCCFGRSCLLTNFGYLSETAASVVDERLGFFVVPKTRVVRLASKSFCYKTGDRKKKTLPPKIGSLQTFVKDFKDARYWLRGWEAKDPPLHSDISKTFLILFQKMIILDYVIRNTGFSAQISVYENRSDENWMIKYDPGTPPASPEPSGTPVARPEPNDKRTSTKRKIAVSDSKDDFKKSKQNENGKDGTGNNYVTDRSLTKSQTACSTELTSDRPKGLS